MTTYSKFSLFVITTAFLNSCSSHQKENLIVGKWQMDDNAIKLLKHSHADSAARSLILLGALGGPTTVQFNADHSLQILDSTGKAMPSFNAQYDLKTTDGKTMIIRSQNSLKDTSEITKLTDKELIIQEGNVQMTYHKQ